MSIQDKCRQAGIAMIAVLAIGGITAGYQIDQIRLGGPIARNNQQISDLEADILPPPAYVIEPFLQATMLVNDPATIGDRQPALARLERDYRASIARWKATAIEPGLKAMLVDQAGRNADRFWRELDTIMIPALRRGDTAAARASYARVAGDYEAHRRDIDRLVVAAATAQQALAANSATKLTVAVALLAGLGALVAALLIGAIVYLMRRVLRPIGATAEAMRRMADGDLSVALDGRERDDEIGMAVSAVEVFRTAVQAQVDSAREQKVVVDELVTALGELGEGNMTYRIGDTLPGEYRGLAVSFNDTMTQLSHTLVRVQMTAGHVKTSASEVNAASDDLSQRTEQQAASLEETAAAMDEITTAVRDTAGGALRVNAIVQNTRDETRASGEVVRRAVEAMGHIERASGEISEIISVIDGIAFQTNLLALNAGVEAARAGDAGKGFAVVASEVRALAQRSAEAARDVKNRINSSTSQVGVGVELVRETGQALHGISERIGEISALVADIASSAERQAAGLQQVNTGVSEMDSVTQQNAAMVEEATAAARHLASEADVLAREVARFRLEHGGTVTASPGRRAGGADAVRLAMAS